MSICSYLKYINLLKVFVQPPHFFLKRSGEHFYFSLISRWKGVFVKMKRSDYEKHKNDELDSQFVFQDGLLSFEKICFPKVETTLLDIRGVSIVCINQIYRYSLY